MSSFLITGGCGFIGSNLAVAFRKAGHEVTAFDNLSRRGSELLLRRVLDHGVHFQHGDIRCPEDLARLRDGAEVMLECSAEPSVLVGADGADARFMLNNNLCGSLNCFEFARQRRMGVIFLSTSRVYPYDAINRAAFREAESRFEPLEDSPGLSPRGIATDFPLAGARSLYGATKLASELILQEYSAQYDMPALINRCGVIAGPWQLGKVDQGVFTYWLAAHYFGKPLRYIGFGGAGKQVRDLLHVEDLAALLLAQAATLGPRRGDVFNVGGGPGSSLSLVETTAICRRLTGNAPPIGADPRNRPSDVIWYVTDNGNTEPVFNWRPTRAAEAILADTADWLRENEPLFRPLFA